MPLENEADPFALLSDPRLSSSSCEVNQISTGKSAKTVRNGRSL
jgi:hypothetical protein